MATVNFSKVSFWVAFWLLLATLPSQAKRVVPTQSTAADVPAVSEVPIAQSDIPTDAALAAQAFPITIFSNSDWDGNDGPWSSFSFRTGNPPQTQKLLISTSSRSVLLVSSSGCTSSDPPDCATQRGGTFDPTKSSTWVANTIAVNTSLSLQSSLGYDVTGNFGFDDFADSFSFLPQLNQSIATFAGQDTYVGIFGICPRSTTLPGSTVPAKSYLENLRDNGTIPSLTWSYTAGGPYRKGTQYGSLVFGGYDQARFIAHDITWPFDKDEFRDLTVKVESVTSFGWGGNRDQKSLLQTPISMFLDSSLPYIWLPLEACLLFEKEFGLIWDVTTELYLVNDTLHDSLLAADPSVIFAINNGTEGFTVNITLPYAAFDLTASRPLVQNPSRYFPLKRANSTTEYILGRTFFQEAYVTADYERHTFSVHQCKGVANNAEDIWPIDSLNGSSTDASAGGTSTGAGLVDALTPSPSSSSVGPAVGGTIGGVALGGILTMIYFFYVRPKRQKTEDVEEKSEAPPSPIEDVEETTFSKPELDHDGVGVYEINADREPVETEVKEQAIYELEGVKGVVESDARERYLHEMAAVDEVARELRADDGAIELASPVPVVPGAGESSSQEDTEHDTSKPERTIAELDANKDVKYVRLSKTDGSKDSSSSKWTWISFR
ncbi:hypothetical protein ONS96_004500 [Cadophora gregata f. sp. sojae]|nr:hypothetical protein ONS96_004500 [Cadophora gregata f. sp. sojae]